LSVHIVLAAAFVLSQVWVAVHISVTHAVPGFGQSVAGSVHIVPELVVVVVVVVVVIPEEVEALAPVPASGANCSKFWVQATGRIAPRTKRERAHRAIRRTSQPPG
jgi:hypothetical protein